VHVEQHGTRGAGDFFLGVDEGVAGGFEELGGQAAALEHLLEVFGVAADVRAVGGDVGDGKESRKLGDDFLLVGGDAGLDGGAQVGGEEGNHGQKKSNRR
jgi:hypothetical protein